MSQIRLVEYSHAAKLGLWFDGVVHFILRGSKRYLLSQSRDEAKRHFFETVRKQLEHNNG